MNEQTALDLVTMQLLFDKAIQRISEKGFTEDAENFKASCYRLTEIIENHCGNFSPAKN